MWISLCLYSRLWWLPHAIIPGSLAKCCLWLQVLQQVDTMCPVTRSCTSNDVEDLVATQLRNLEMTPWKMFDFGKYSILNLFRKRIKQYFSIGPLTDVDHAQAVWRCAFFRALYHGNRRAQSWRQTRGQHAADNAKKKTNEIIPAWENPGLKINPAWKKKETGKIPTWKNPGLKTKNKNRLTKPGLIKKNQKLGMELRARRIRISIPSSGASSVGALGLYTQGFQN